MLIKLMHEMLKFQTITNEKLDSLLRQLSGGQNPGIFFITCSDSRVIPSLFTNSQPGDLFVHRNVGNIFPPYPSFSSEATGLEFALHKFDLKDIIVCGHSKCGAMEGLLTPGLDEKLPTTASWLRHSNLILKKIEEQKDSFANDASKLSFAIEQNVLLQLEHLKTYPVVAQKLARNELTVHGWLFDIKSGTIDIYEPAQNKFVSLQNAYYSAIEERKNKIITKIARDHLEQLTHPKSAKEYQRLNQVLGSLHSNIASIWDSIKEQVWEKLWAELGQFYAEPEDKIKFISSVESASEIKLGDLDQFRKNMSASDGYQKFCSQLIRNSFFSKSTKIKDANDYYATNKPITYTVEFPQL